MPIAERSLRKTADIFYSGKNKGKPARKAQRTQVERWSSKHDWVVRVRAWEGKIEKEKRKRALEEIHSMYERHAKIAAAMQGKIIEYLNQTFTQKDLTPTVVARWLEVSSKLESLSRNESNERMEKAPVAEGDAQARIVALIMDGTLPDSVVQAIASAPVEDVERILKEQAGHIPEVRQILAEV